MTEKPSTDKVIIVEGKYDRARLSEVLDATIIETNGFGIFKDARLAKTIPRLAKERGIVILTDSDSAGLLIRNRIISLAGTENVKNVYIPDIEGKERRKPKPSKEGLLGVEGTDHKTLLKILSEANIFNDTKNPERISKTDMYVYGLSGRPGSKKLREEIKKKLMLPEKMSPDKLLEMLNVLITKNELENMINEITGGIGDV